MSAIKEYLVKNWKVIGTRSSKMASYSMALTALVLVILIAVNLLVGSLPSTWTHYDISSAQLYSVTSSTKAVVQNLEKDVTIYWITQSGKEDDILEKLLDVYASLSSHLTVVKKNPDVSPTFAAQYTDDTVQNNTLIVESGEKYRVLPYNEIYQADTTSYYTTGSVAYDFDGEGMITTAISYVVSDNLPKLYLLEGHGEAELSDSFVSALNRQNLETESLSLLIIDEIPEDASGILINAPASDISQEEANILIEYIGGGGNVLVLSGPQESEKMENLRSVLAVYGVTVTDGVLVENDRGHYAFSMPYVLLPELGDSEITSELSENNSYLIVPISAGLTISSSVSGATVTPLLTTTEQSYSKAAGYQMETLEKEEGDTDGPFTVALSVENTASGGKLVWVSSDAMMDEMYISYSSGANSDFIMNALSWMIGQEESIAIRSKSLDYNYLTISDAQATFLKVILIGAIPLLFLIYGIDELIHRRRAS